MPLVLSLAWRFFRGNRQQGLVSLISTISIAGMSLAVAILIVVLSVMNGFEREFSERILGVTPHGRLQFETPQKDWPTLQKLLMNQPGIKSVSPYSELQALALSGTAATPLGVIGIELSSTLASLQPYIRWHSEAGGAEQSLNTGLLGDGDIIIGAELGRKMGLGTGDYLRLLRIDSQHSHSASGAFGQNNTRTQLYTARVVGLLTTGTQLDTQIGVVSLEYANALKAQEGAVQGLQFKVDDVFNARSIIFSAATASNAVGYVSDWKSEFGNLYTAIQLSRQLVVMLVATIVAVAVFNIFVTLGMVVRYKRNEIAVLKTLGLTRHRILTLFCWQGLIIALPGCIIGVIAGILVTLALPDSVVLLQTALGIELLSTEVYPINYLPAELRWLDVLTIIGMALGMSFIATLIPAWQASRLAPAVVLKHRS